MLRRAAWIALAAAVSIAVFASFLASDRPLVLHLEGRTYWLPNVVDYDALADARGEALRARMGPDDWAVWAPVRHGPTSVRSSGQLRVLAAPSATHWLGTDDRGRDVLARLIHGTRATVLIAVFAMLLALAVGTALGAFAAGRGGLADSAVVGVCDLLGAVPALLVIVAVQGLVGRSGYAVMIGLIALPRIGDIARVARAEISGALAQPYCDAARSMGASELRIVVRQALPQARTALAVAAAMTAVTAVLGEAALSFLGFGVPAPGASWGELLKQAHENDLRWWLAWPPGIVIASLAAALGAVAQPKSAAS